MKKPNGMKSNKMDITEANQALSFGKVMSHSYKRLSEEEYDSVDLELEKIKMAFEAEMNLFIFELLKQYNQKFNWSFAAPNSELFGSSWKALQDRYQLMDDTGKLDLYKKLGTFLIKVFLDMFPNAGEKAAVEMADVFKGLMIDRLRDQSIQARKI